MFLELPTQPKQPTMTKIAKIAKIAKVGNTVGIRLLQYFSIIVHFQFRDESRNERARDQLRIQGMGEVPYTMEVKSWVLVPRKPSDHVRRLMNLLQVLSECYQSCKTVTSLVRVLLVLSECYKSCQTVTSVIGQLQVFSDCYKPCKTVTRHVTL